MQPSGRGRSGERASAKYENAVAWCKWRADWAPGVSSETLLSLSDLKNRRSGNVDLPGVVSGAIAERGEFGANGLRHDWTLIPSKRWMLRLGFDIKKTDATFQLMSSETVFPPFSEILGNAQSQAFD